MRESLFDVLIDLFRWVEEVGNPIPSFADELTLLISNDISTQDKTAGTQEMKRLDICLPSGKARLREHILSSKLGDLDLYNVYVYYEMDVIHFWHWAPPSGGSFARLRIIGDQPGMAAHRGDRVNWRGFRKWVSWIEDSS
jgi:hypothetical protein